MRDEVCRATPVRHNYFSFDLGIQNFFMTRKDPEQSVENSDRHSKENEPAKGENNKEPGVETKVKNASASGLGSIGRNDEKLSGAPDDSLDKY
jgi:hypothetical protein